MRMRFHAVRCLLSRPACACRAPISARVSRTRVLDERVEGAEAERPSEHVDGKASGGGDEDDKLLGEEVRLVGDEIGAEAIRCLVDVVELVQPCECTHSAQTRSGGAGVPAAIRLQIQRGGAERGC